MPTLLFALALDSWVVPKAYFEKVGAKEFGRNPIGSGPYKVTEFTPGSEVKLTANLNYWAGAPAIGELDWKNLPDPATRMSALKAGEIGIAIDLPSDIAASLKVDARVHAAKFLPLLTYSLAPDTIHGGPLANLKVRQALAHAIETSSMLQALFGGAGVRTSQPVTSNTLGFNPDLKPWTFDPGLSKQLLTEAGYPDGFSMTLFTKQGAERELTADAVASQWTKIGVKTSVRVVDAGVFIDTRSSNVSGKPRVFLDLWGTAGDSFFVAPWYTAKSSWGVTYSDPETDAEIEQAASSINTDMRVDLYQRIWAQLHDNVAFIPLYNLPLFWGVDNALTNLNLNPIQQLYLYNVAEK